MAIIETEEELKAYRDKVRKNHRIKRLLKVRENYKVWYSKPKNRIECSKKHKERYKNPRTRKMIIANSLKYYYKNRDKINAKRRRQRAKCRNLSH